MSKRNGYQTRYETLLTMMEKVSVGFYWLRKTMSNKFPPRSGSTFTLICGF